MLPWGCLPLWGREGVTLILAVEINFVTKKRSSAKQKKLNFFPISFGIFAIFPLIISDQFWWLK